MPNHVTNGVSIHHDDAAKLKELREKLIIREKGEDGDWDSFDFNAIIPMPKELMITSGSTTDLGMACFNQKKFDSYKSYHWFDERYPNCDTPEKLRKLLENSKDDSDRDALREGKQALDNIKKYGYKDWYDWSVENWGTKWNAYSFSIIAEDENNLHVQFDTAWAPPTPIFDELEEMGFTVSAVSINEDSGVEPDYYGLPENFYVERSLEFYQ